jgi:hypothetical protein
VAKYFKISVGELLPLSANGLQSQTKEAEIRVGGGDAILGWDDIETDQVVVVVARTTIADAAMILSMKCIAFLRGIHRVRPANRHLRFKEAMRGPIQAM